MHRFYISTVNVNVLPVSKVKFSQSGSSLREVFCKKAVLKNFGTAVFCEFCEVFKNTFFIEHIRWLFLSKLYAVLNSGCFFAVIKEEEQ